ncbi:MAG: matrixin family metalloprotease [Phycisphaeraceae bacterium]|nr:matrixin family metalloprotease [Phycisphaeraceae bacterium]
MRRDLFRSTNGTLVGAALSAAALLSISGLAAAADETPHADCDSSCCSADTMRVLDAALDAYCASAEDPACRKEELLERIARSPLCFSPKSSPKQMENIIRMYDSLPPGLLAEGDLRFFVAGTTWVGAGVVGGAGTATATSLTYSFPIDGVSWGDPGSGFPAGPNVLNARFDSAFGAGNNDRGREYVRQFYGSWRRYCGLTYNEVSDDNAGYTTSTANVPTRGNIRVGSTLLDGANGVLAYNYFPSSGGDMVLDSGDFTGGNFLSSTNNYRFFRNVLGHEHGHGLGMIHTVPCNNTKLMEPFINVNFDSLQIDDIRGGQRNFGDRFSGNNSAANAKDFGDITAMSIIQPELSTNGTSGANNSDEDWFRFTLFAAQNVTITVDPTGGSYTNGQQSSSCNGSTTTVNADQAGNLNLELRSADGTSVIASSSSAPAGSNEVITQPLLPAGTYTVRVVDVGPNANQTVQLYTLTIRVGIAKAPPQAIAGVNKRIQAGQTCFFMGNINSRPLESGVAITTYAWDLDGNGTFEIANNATPNRTYSVNGVYPVTLRVTDSNGMSATDTILVTVFGGASGVVVSNISPNTGAQGTVVPVTITGTGLHNVDSATDVVVSGTGVTVTGSPSVNPGGTVVTGLSFNVSGGATLGSRNVTVTTEDGADTANNSFTVIANVLPTVDSVSPTFGRQGFSVPVTITGTNFGNVNSASDVVVSGTGVAVSGTPIVTNGNTTITGLSFDIADDAPSGTQFRSVTVSTIDGVGSLTMGFRVRCLADWDGNSVVTPADIATFINNWTMDISQLTLNTDVDHDNVITPSDIAVFIASWFNSVSNGCS